MSGAEPDPNTEEPAKANDQRLEDPFIHQVAQDPHAHPGAQPAPYTEEPAKTIYPWPEEPFIHQDAQKTHPHPEAEPAPYTEEPAKANVPPLENECVKEENQNAQVTSQPEVEPEPKVNDQLPNNQSVKEQHQDAKETHPHPEAEPAPNTEEPGKGNVPPLEDKSVKEENKSAQRSYPQPEVEPTPVKANDQLPEGQSVKERHQDAQKALLQPGAEPALNIEESAKANDQWIEDSFIHQDVQKTHPQQEAEPASYTEEPAKANVPPLENECVKEENQNAQGTPQPELKPEVEPEPKANDQLPNYQYVKEQHQDVKETHPYPEAEPAPNTEEPVKGNVPPLEDKCVKEENQSAQISYPQPEVESAPVKANDQLPEGQSVKEQHQDAQKSLLQPWAEPALNIEEPAKTNNQWPEDPFIPQDAQETHPQPETESDLNDEDQCVKKENENTQGTPQPVVEPAPLKANDNLPQSAKEHHQNTQKTHPQPRAQPTPKPQEPSKAKDQPLEDQSVKEKKAMGKCQAAGHENQPCDSVMQYEKIAEPKSEMNIRGKGPVKYFTPVSKNTSGSHQDFKRRLQNEVSDLQEVFTEDECDIFLLFLPIISCGGIDTDTVLKELNGISVSKPAVLVVLHYTVDPEKVILDSSKLVERQNTVTVDCLINEDKGLLKCCKNEEAVKKVKEWLKGLRAKAMAENKPHDSAMQYKKIPRPKSKMTIRGNKNVVLNQPEKIKNIITRSPGKGPIKYFIHVSGNTSGSHEEFKRRLQTEVSGLREVSTQDECEIFLLFLPIISCGGIDSDTVLKRLDDISVSKPAVLVVLHYTVDPEKVILDSSKLVERQNTVTVDCLFHEDKGLLKCSRNESAVKKVKEWLESQRPKPMDSQNSVVCICCRRDVIC